MNNHNNNNLSLRWFKHERFYIYIVISGFVRNEISKIIFPHLVIIILFGDISMVGNLQWRI